MIASYIKGQIVIYRPSIVIHRPSIEPDSFRDALPATFVGDWEEPSGESWLEPQEGTIKDVRD